MVDIEYSQDSVVSTLEFDGAIKCDKKPLPILEAWPKFDSM